MKNKNITPEQQQKILAAFEASAGNITATARKTGFSRSAVRDNLKRLGKLKKPIAAGSVAGTAVKEAALPKRGVKRYILTSAQNNTRVHDRVWDGLMAFAEHYGAEVLVGTFSYNQNAYGELA